MRAACLLLAACACLPAADKRIAITIDDLPLAGSDGPCRAEALADVTRTLLSPVRKEKIPVTGFVIGSRCADLGAEKFEGALGRWLDAGAELGNHTYSHPDLNSTSLADYEADIEKAEPALRAAIARRGGTLRYFRHPMLHAGRDLATKDALAAWLKARGYTIAPVTLDNSDWMFAAVYADALRSGDRALAARVRREYVPYMESILEFFEGRAVEVTGREIPQVLLIHASRLNAECLPDLLRMMRRRGYRFVPLGEVLADPAYSLPDRYAGPGGFSWIHRWSMTMGLRGKGEPDEPKFISEAYARMRKSK
jgi:peptidoglycan/xylan/chitin deacetylase (PgdA/CDA1 family)